MFSSPSTSPTSKPRSRSTPGSSAPSPPSAAPATRTSLSEPPLKLVLIEGPGGEDTCLDHLGVEVASTDDVTAATDRLKDAGLATFEENDTSCCYAVQDKVWVTGPGQEPWEVYVVKADADQLGKAATPGGEACCSNRPEAARAAEPVGTPAAAGCACGS